MHTTMAEKRILNRCLLIHNEMQLYSTPSKTLVHVLFPSHIDTAHKHTPYPLNPTVTLKRLRVHVCVLVFCLFVCFLCCYVVVSSFFFCSCGSFFFNSKCFIVQTVQDSFHCCERRY